MSSVFRLVKFRFPRMPIAVEFTREGVIFVLLSLAIGAAAVNTGNNVLYLIFSLMLGMIVVSGIASRRVLQGLLPTLQFPDHLFAGIQSLCYISISNIKKRLPSLAIRFAVRDPKFTSISRHFFYIPAQNHASGYARFVFSRRGVFTLREMELQTQFPFSFFLKIRRYFLEHPVRVYPRNYRFTEDILSRFSEGILRESPYRGDSQQLLHLRDYSAFDSTKRIHWKASAKAEKLLVKEYQREQGRDLHLYFDCFTDDPHDPTLETALSFAASLAFLFKEKEIDARIIFPGKVFDTAISIIPLLSYLAEWDGKFSSNEKLELPESKEMVVLQLRSRKFNSQIALTGSGTRNLFVEDWQHLMREDSTIQI
jgi:uncharacterized protein (DUF58 family)